MEKIYNEREKKKTSFCLEAVSSVSRTSISVWTSYFFITSGSLNSDKGIRATKQTHIIKDQIKSSTDISKSFEFLKTKTVTIKRHTRARLSPKMAARLIETVGIVVDDEKGVTFVCQIIYSPF